MRRVQRWSAIISMVVAAMVLGGPAWSASHAPERLERIKVALNASVNNLNMCKGSAAGPDAQLTGLIAGYLFRWGPDSELIPELAESLTSEDSMTWTLKLRPDAVYSDGTPVTAEDVVYQYERCKENPGTYKVFIDSITSVEAVDPQTVVYRMSTPKAIFPQFFGYWFSQIWPKEQIVAAGEDEFFKRPVGAGPYILSEGQVGSPSFVLTENPTYILGPRAAKEIELVAVPDITSRALQLVQGQLDYVYQLPPSMVQVDTPGVEKWVHIPGALYRLTFNGGLPEDHPLSDRDVREAISLAIDREAIVSRAFFGLNTPAQGDAPSWMDDAVVATYPDGGKRDVEAAKAKLAGTPFKDGFGFKLMTWGDRPGYLDTALIIRENLKELGIDVSIENVQVGVAFERMTNGDFEANFGNHGGGGPLLSWWSNQYTPDSFWGSKAKYDDPAMTELLDRIDQETDTAAVKGLWREAQEHAYADPETGLSFISVTDDSGHLSGSRLGREIIGAVAGRDNFWVAAAEGAQ